MKRKINGENERFLFYLNNYMYKFLNPLTFLESCIKFKSLSHVTRDRLHDLLRSFQRFTSCNFLFCILIQSH